MLLYILGKLLANSVKPLSQHLAKHEIYKYDIVADVILNYV